MAAPPSSRPRRALLAALAALAALLLLPALAGASVQYVSVKAKDTGATPRRRARAGGHRRRVRHGDQRRPDPRRHGPHGHGHLADAGRHRHRRLHRLPGRAGRRDRPGPRPDHGEARRRLGLRRRRPPGPRPGRGRRAQHRRRARPHRGRRPPRRVPHDHGRQRARRRHRRVGRRRPGRARARRARSGSATSRRPRSATWSSRSSRPTGPRSCCCPATRSRATALSGTLFATNGASILGASAPFTGTYAIPGLAGPRRHGGGRALEAAGQGHRRRRRRPRAVGLVARARAVDVRRPGRRPRHRERPDRRPRPERDLRRLGLDRAGPGRDADLRLEGRRRRRRRGDGPPARPQLARQGASPRERDRVRRQRRRDRRGRRGGDGAARGRAWPRCRRACAPSTPSRSTRAGPPTPTAPWRRTPGTSTATGATTTRTRRRRGAPSRRPPARTPCA